MTYIVQEAAYLVLKDYPEGLTVKQITDKIISRNLYTFKAQKPEEIVARALDRHCKGIDRNYSCQEKYFTRSKGNTSSVNIYKHIPNSLEFDRGIAETFEYPQYKVGLLNDSGSTVNNAKTRIMDAKNQTVRNLLDRYCFFVPDYQRSYSWNASQIDEFLDDVFNVLHSDNQDARHFLGAITMSKRSNRQGDVDLIDGQQRITTIFIFLYVVLSEYLSDRFKDKAHGRADVLIRKLAFLDDDGNNAGSRLVLGAFNRSFFEEYIIKGHNLPDEEKENIKSKYKEKHEYNQNQAIFEAFNRIKLAIDERLDCCGNEDNAYEYLKALHMCLYDRFELVTMEVEEEADAFLIFETLNDRGLVLSAVDLIKNKLFQAFSTRANEFTQLKSDWEVMCENIENKDNLKKYLLHYWRSKLGHVSSQTLYKTCRDYIAKDSYNRAKSIVKDLKEYSTYYNGLCDPMAAHPWTNKILKNALDDMNRIGYDMARPLLLAAVRRYPHDEEKISVVARMCLNFMIRYISVLKNKPTSIEKDISVWACDPSFSIEMLKAKFEEKAPDAKFKEALSNISIPYTSPLAHYLLCVYEAEGFNRKEFWTSPGRSNNTVEHILPQEVNATTPSGQYWLTQFDSQDNCSIYIERLGNYAFLTKTAQSKALNREFEHKKFIYSTETDMRLTKELTKYADWNPQNIIARQVKMAEVLTKAISFDF